MLNFPLSRWWTVVAGFAASAVGSGTIMVYSYGILAANMGAELGWDRAATGAGFTAFLIGNGFGSILLGSLIPRYGIRLPSTLFAATFGSLFALNGLVVPTPTILVVVFFIAGIGGAACTALPYAVAISGFFDRQRGLALGIVVAGSGMGATFGAPVVQRLIDSGSWETGFLVIGLVNAVVSIFGLVLLVRTPEGTVRSPGTISQGDGGATQQATFLEIFRMRSFWIIVIAIGGVSIGTFGGMASLVPLFHDKQISPTTITHILATAGLASWIARPVVGFLLDKIFAPYLCAVLFIGAAVGLALLIAVSGEGTAYVGAALIAMALGAEADLVTFLVSRYFALIDFSRVVGLVWVMWAWGGGIGTSLAGQLYAYSGGYNLAFSLFSVGLILSAVAIAVVGPYRNPVGISTATQRMGASQPQG